MDNLPFTIHTPEQERLVSAIMDSTLVTFDQGLNLHVRDGPSKVTLEVGFNICQRQFETFQGIAFWFNVMLHQIVKAFILAA
jgi:hypothetical protein